MTTLTGGAAWVLTWSATSLSDWATSDLADATLDAEATAAAGDTDTSAGDSDFVTGADVTFGAALAEGSAVDAPAALAADLPDTDADTEADTAALPFEECLEPREVVDADPAGLCALAEFDTFTPPVPVDAAGVEVPDGTESADSDDLVDAPDERGALDDEVPSAPLDVEGEPLASVSSAWAIPDPLASAAPKPRVTAPAPSQV